MTTTTPTTTTFPVPTLPTSQDDDACEQSLNGTLVLESVRGGPRNALPVLTSGISFVAHAKVMTNNITPLLAASRAAPDRHYRTWEQNVDQNERGIRLLFSFETLAGPRTERPLGMRHNFGNRAYTAPTGATTAKKPTACPLMRPT